MTHSQRTPQCDGQMLSVTAGGLMDPSLCPGKLQTLFNFILTLKKKHSIRVARQLYQNPHLIYAFLVKENKSTVL